MKEFRNILAALLLCTAAYAGNGDFETASDAVRHMRIGWNLGNTLDSNSGDTLNMWIERWTNRLPTAYETAWGQPVTKSELMKLFKNAGFNAIRVPVTWYPHMEAKFSFTGNSTVWYPSSDDFGSQIQAAWMQRVHEIVDYVIDQGMYCVLNIHHDTGAANTAWLIADETVYQQQRERFEAIWTQIAEEFRDYGDHLLFEGYNEMLDVKQSWCFASFAASGNYNAAIAQSAYNGINSYAQSFVNAVRATGGNNAQRNLIVSTYGACDGHGTWNTHLKDPLKQMKRPEDSAQDHIIFEVHSYPDVKNLTTAKREMDECISALKTHLISKGAPLIFGEWGTSTDNAYTSYKSNLLAFARYFVEQCKANGIGTFYWMGLSDASDRSVPQFTQPDLVDAIVKGWYGENGNVAVEAVDAEEPFVDVYSLSGVKLRRHVPRQQLRSVLPKGIYVVNGKKMAI